MEIRVNRKENWYFALKILFTAVVLCALAALVNALVKNSETSMTATIVTFVVYVLLIWIFIIFQKIYLIAYMKGNGIQVSSRQFPGAYEVYMNIARELGLKSIPKLFILQQGGLLNAFAVRFSGRNYLAIYSDIFSLISSDMDAVKFVLGHELGHVKRNHMSKRFWTFPSSIIPFLTAAYSRSCEYTCDNIGNAFVHDMPLNGLLVLAAGKELYREVDIDNYIEDSKGNNSLAVKFAGLCMSHPYLPKRLENLKMQR